MKRKVSAVISAMLVMVMLFSSCDSLDVIRPVENLLLPPLYHEEYKELVNVFRKSVSENVIFCSPQQGEHRSAIIVEDVDSDDEEEALIFYKEGVESSVARMHYFDAVDGEWISKGDFDGYGNAIDKIVLTDMDSDGSTEFVVLWGISGVTSGNVMSVYRSVQGEYKEISNETCTVCEVADIDGDSNEEIFYMNQVTVSGVSQRYAKVMKLSGETVVLLGEAKVDPNISSYVSVKTEKSSEDAPLKFYIDALKGESQMITELVYWDSARSVLVAPLLDAETTSNAATLRYEPIASTDINNDGIIDIPVQSKTLNSGNSAESIYVTDWINYSDGKISTVANTVINYTDGYMIYLNEDELDKTGIRSYMSQNCWVVYSVSGKTEKELYSILKISTDRWNDEEFSSYIPIIEREDSVICAYITQSGLEQGIDSDYIISRMVKIS